MTTVAAAPARAGSRGAPGELLPPGPRIPASLLTYLWLTRPIDLLDRCRRTYGDTFTLRLLGRRIVVTAHPDFARQVFVGDSDQLRAGAFNEALEPMFGAGSLLLLDGDRHLRERKLLLPPFHGERLHVYAQTIGEIVDREIDGWGVGQRVSLYDSMERVTLEIIMRTVFGVDDDRRRRELSESFRALTNTGGLMLLFPRLRLERPSWGAWPRFKALKSQTDARLIELIRERRASASSQEHSDVLSLLLRARDEGGAEMTDEDLKDQLVTLLLAGHETTAASLAWLFDYVLRDAGIVDRLRAESAAGEEGYLGAVVDEALRLRPVISIVGRKLAAPLALGRWHLPAGDSVMVAIHLLHRRAELFPEPDRFRPERFLDGRPPRHANAPFGVGIRRCIGASFAPHEMRIVTRAVVDRTRLRLLRAEPERPIRRGPTIAPKDGTRVVVEART